jgi:hypothetical protein
VRTRVQKPLGSTMRRGALLPSERRSLSPETRISALPSTALARTQRSSGSRILIFDGALGFGITSYSRRNCSISSTIAAGSLSLVLRTLFNSRKTTSPTTSSCSARIWRNTSAHSPRVAKALTNTLVSRNTLTKRLWQRLRRSGILWLPRMGALGDAAVRNAEGPAAVARLREQSRSSSSRFAWRGGRGACSGLGLGGS